MSVGPIIFSDPIARGQLEDEGEVVTFRTSDRTVGSTWWRESRTGPKRGDVVVERIGSVDAADADALEPYRHLSGFETVTAWQRAIEELNGEVGEGFLFRTSTSQTTVEGWST